MLKILRWIKQNIILIIEVAVAIAFTVTLWIMFFLSGDFKAATEEEWKQLYEQVAILENQGMEKIFDLEDGIEITIDGRYVTVKSEQCAVTLETNDWHKFINPIEKDEAILGFSRIVALLACTILSVILGFYFWLLEGIVVIGVDATIEKIRLKRKREP